MQVGDLLLDEKTHQKHGKNSLVIFLGYNEWNEIKVMYPNGFIYQGCELRFKEIKC